MAPLWILLCIWWSTHKAIRMLDTPPPDIAPVCRPSDLPAHSLVLGHICMGWFLPRVGTAMGWGSCVGGFELLAGPDAGLGWGSCVGEGHTHTHLNTRAHTHTHTHARTHTPTHTHTARAHLNTDDYPSKSARSLPRISIVDGPSNLPTVSVAPRS